MTNERIVEFRDALRDNDTTKVVELFDGFDDAVDSQEKREIALQNVARGLTARVATDEPANQTAQEFFMAVNKAQQARLETKFDHLLYLQGGQSAEAVAEKVDTVLSATEQVETLASELREYATDISLPGTLSLTGPSNIVAETGSAVDATYTVTNLGGSPIENVEVSLAVEADLSIEPRSIASIEPGDNVSITVTGTVDEPTESPLIVSADEARARASLEVIDEDGYFERALRILDEIEEQLVLMSANDELPEDALEGLGEKIETARTRINDVREDIGDRPGHALANRVQAIQNHLGAFINQVEGLSNAHLSDRAEAVLSSDAELAIEALAAAEQALSDRESNGRGNRSGRP